MTTGTWEKTKTDETVQNDGKGERIKFAIGGILLLGAVAYLILSGTITGAQYFISVDDLVHNSDYVGQTVRITGAVIGDTIDFDASDFTLDFTIAHMDGEFEDLAQELYTAVNDSSRTQLAVHLEGEPMPDLLQHEAQAILTGEIGSDGVFYASELLLKCPSRYEEAVPQQVAQNAS